VMLFLLLLRCCCMSIWMLLVDRCCCSCWWLMLFIVNNYPVVISKLIEWNPNKRITASQMLNHPWVQGKTASQEKMEASDKKLSKYRVFKARLEAQVFGEFVHWVDRHDLISKRTSLLERSFRKFDPQHKRYITATDLKDWSNGDAANSDEDCGRLSMAGFSDLLGENMKNRYLQGRCCGGRSHCLFCITWQHVRRTLVDIWQTSQHFRHLWFRRMQTARDASSRFLFLFGCTPSCQEKCERHLFAKRVSKGVGVSNQTPFPDQAR
jgi:hypothetical protein